MKKNITINMFGRLYSIDEDAYQLLQHYIDTLRNYFSRKPDGKEITDDIEARIAELFDDLRAKGVEAINIGHVQTIISRIGDPKQMEDGDDRQSEPEAQGASDDGPGVMAEGIKDRAKAYFEQLRKSNKRLYRDPADKKFTGLLAGCAQYFGGDVLWWRLGFVLLFLLSLWFGSVVNRWHGGVVFGSFSLWLPAFYMVMAILTPMAQNPEDRLMMKGMDVTPGNLAHEVNEERMQADAPRMPQSGASGCLSGFIRFFLFLVKALLVCVGLLAALVICVGITVMMLLMVSPDIFGDARFARLYASSVSSGMVAVCVAGLLGVLVISVYCLVHAIMSSRQKIDPMGLTQRAVWVALWMVCLMAAIFSGVTMTARFSQAEDRLDEIEDRAYVKANTHDGVFIDEEDWDFLNRGGWRLIDPMDGRNRYTDNGEHYSGKGRLRYLNGYADWGLSYQVERSNTDLAPGTYTLTVTARTDGKGAFVYAVADGRRYMVEIPVCGNEGGSVWQEARRHVDSKDSMATDADRRLYQSIAEANGGRGFGWSRVVIDGIRVSKGSLSYGISTNSNFTGASFSGQWVSATDFSVEQR